MLRSSRRALPLLARLLLYARLLHGELLCRWLETQTKTVTVADTTATVSFDAWTTVTITKVSVNSTVTLSKDGAAVASVTNGTATATLYVAGTVTDYTYAITASDAVVVGGTGDVSGATFTANEKIYKLGTVTIAAEASGLAAKITVPTAASYTALTADEKVSYTVSMVKDGSETVLETRAACLVLTLRPAIPPAR